MLSAIHISIHGSVLCVLQKQRGRQQHNRGSGDHSRVRTIGCWITILWRSEAAGYDIIAAVAPASSMCVLNADVFLEE